MSIATHSIVIGTNSFDSSLQYTGYSVQRSTGAPASISSGYVSKCVIIFLQQMYSANLVGLYMNVRTCLEEERRIVSQVSVIIITFVAAALTKF
jgi:hypothetical protein